MVNRFDDSQTFSGETGVLSRSSGCRGRRGHPEWISRRNKKRKKSKLK